jgi:hypothetical protein
MPYSNSDKSSSLSVSGDENDMVELDRPKKPRTRGYRIGSDDSVSSESVCNEDEKRPLLDEQGLEDDEWESEIVVKFSPGTLGWLMGSILPTYTEKVLVQPRFGHLERLLSSFTTYKDLKDATLDSHYEAIFTRLQQEWTYVGGLVCLDQWNAYHQFLITLIFFK